MIKWEYLFLNYGGEVENWVKLQDRMSDMGEQGWELVTYMNDIHIEPIDKKRRLFIFKRPKQPEKRKPKAA